MTPPPDPKTLDVLDARVRQLEVRYAQLVDRIDIYGPPPRRSPIPELTDSQRQTVSLILVAFLLITIRAVYAYERTKGSTP